MIAALGIGIVSAFWIGVFGFIWIGNALRRRRARPGAPPPHSISWIELVPLAGLAVGAMFVLERVSRNLGYEAVGGLHVVAVLAGVVFLLRHPR